MLLVLNSFIKNLLMTKSKACRLDLVKGQAFRPYKRTGKHLLLSKLNSVAEAKSDSNSGTKRLDCSNVCDKFMPSYPFACVRRSVSSAKLPGCYKYWVCFNNFLCEDELRNS